MRIRKTLRAFTVILFLTGFVVLGFGEARPGVRPQEESAAEQAPYPGSLFEMKEAQNPCNPCAKKKVQNPCNPCAAKQASGEVYAPATAYNEWAKINSKPFVSKAHNGVFVTTYVNETAQRAIKTKMSAFPVGSILVKESYSNAGGKPGEKGTIFGMEKTAEGWLWVTTDPAGHVTMKGDSGRMAMCAQCHAAANTDSAFLRKK